ncbi:MAG: hypothetical protein WD468_10955 [Pirellulales bacterium]
MKIGTMVILLAVLGFCVFGFMTTFGPMDATMQLVLRALYGTVGLVCLITIAWAVRPQKPQDPQK